MPTSPFFFHYRPQNAIGQFVPRGGVTICMVPLGDGHYMMGVAVCSPLDQFAFNMGRRMAQGRALSGKEGRNMRVFARDMSQLMRIADYYATRLADMSYRWLGMDFMGFCAEKTSTMRRKDRDQGNEGRSVWVEAQLF